MAIPIHDTKIDPNEGPFCHSQFSPGLLPRGFALGGIHIVYDCHMAKFTTKLLILVACTVCTLTVTTSMARDGLSEDPSEACADALELSASLRKSEARYKDLQRQREIDLLAIDEFETNMNNLSKKQFMRIMKLYAKTKTKPREDQEAILTQYFEQHFNTKQDLIPMAKVVGAFATLEIPFPKSFWTLQNLGSAFKQLTTYNRKVIREFFLAIKWAGQLDLLAELIDWKDSTDRSSAPDGRPATLAISHLKNVLQFNELGTTIELAYASASKRNDATKKLERLHPGEQDTLEDAKSYLQKLFPKNMIKENVYLPEAHRYAQLAVPDLDLYIVIHSFKPKQIPEQGFFGSILGRSILFEEEISRSQGRNILRLLPWHHRQVSQAFVERLGKDHIAEIRRWYTEEKAKENN